MRPFEVEFETVCYNVPVRILLFGNRSEDERSCHNVHPCQVCGKRNNEVLVYVGGTQQVV